MLTGKIETYSISMHLHKAGHQYSGYYYYDSQQQPIYFIGEDTSQKGRIKLLSFAASEGNEEFNFTLINGAATGFWKKDENSKARSFSANKASIPFSFTYVYTAGSAKLRPDMKNSPQAVYDAASVCQTRTRQPVTFLKTLLANLFRKIMLKTKKSAICCSNKRSRILLSIWGKIKM